MDFVQARTEMIREQLIGRGISDVRVLAAMNRIPRERFVPREYQLYAYDDAPQHIGEAQTISQPYIVALMTQSLKLTGGETVLEVGTGSGYQTAILAVLAAHVYSIERYQGLADSAREVLDDLEILNVDVTVGDGSLGWSDRAPFDSIIITAAAPAMPMPLIDQLTERGRIVIPIGTRYDQMLEVWERRGAWHIDKICPVRFVPLIGECGWKG
jgi:protein-L-isoaspartate(D-aspartate) O-methyltransferase